MNTNTRITAWIAMLALVALVLSACGAAAPAEPTLDPNVVFTQVAETVMVSMTQTAESIPPTPTPEPTATAEPTQPPPPTPDPSIPTLTPMPIGPTPTVQRFGDSAKYNTQTPKDGTTFKPSENFIFHVCWGNNGATDWKTSFYMEWIDGPRLSTKSKTYHVGDLVKPGGTWCFDIDSFAPAEPGSYITRWYFRNADGQKLEEVYFNFRVQK